VIDAFSRKVVGWQLASHMRTDLVLDALRMALGQREHGADFELVAHTDRGSQPGLNRSSQQCVGDVNLRVSGGGRGAHDLEDRAGDAAVAVEARP